MVLYSAGKNARRVSSITNNICNLGGNKKGGLVTMQGRTSNVRTAITNQGPYCCVETNLGCIAGLAYLKAKNLMTMNPQCSGGVPHRMYRGCRSGSGSDYVSETGSGPVTDPILLRIASNTSDNLWTLNSTDNVALGSNFTVAQNITFIVPLGTTLTINGTMIIRGIVDVIGTLTVNGTIQIYGTLNVTGTFNMYGNMENFSNNSLNNYGVCQIIGLFKNYGTTSNYGDFVNTGSFMNYAGSNLCNRGNITCGANSQMSFANDNSLINQGEIVVPDLILISIFGIASNTLGIYTALVQSNPVSTAINSIADPTDVEGTWTLRNATNTIVITSQLTIPTGQTLIVPVGSTLRNNHIIFNNGTIINRGTIETYSDGFNVLGDINNDNGRIENNGTIIISRYLINRGSISAPGWFRPRGDVLGGTIENTSTGRINIRPGGRINRCSRFINVGTIDSAGTIMCGLDAIFENNGNGTITNSVNTTGVMENDPTDTLEHGFVYPGELVLNNINNRTDGTGGINRGTINNKPHCRILLTACRLTNIGTVINDGSLRLTHGRFTNNAGSILRNNGTITGQYSKLLISTGSTFARGTGTITGLNPTFFLSVA
jgi:hypothetical protein